MQHMNINGKGFFITPKFAKNNSSFFKKTCRRNGRISSYWILFQLTPFHFYFLASLQRQAKSRTITADFIIFTANLLGFYKKRRDLQIFLMVKIIKNERAHAHIYKLKHLQGWMMKRHTSLLQNETSFVQKIPYEYLTLILNEINFYWKIFLNTNRNCSLFESGLQPPLPGFLAKTAFDATFCQII